jgi:hypothetical protein
MRLWGDRSYWWQPIAIDVKPLALFAKKARSFVQLFHFSGSKPHGLGIPIFRHKFDNARFVGGLAFWGFEYGELDPLSLLDRLAETAFVIGAAGFGMQGGDQIVDVAAREGGVARSHQCFCRWCRDCAVEAGFAAIGVEIATTARTIGWHGAADRAGDNTDSISRFSTLGLGVGFTLGDNGKDLAEGVDRCLMR